MLYSLSGASTETRTSLSSWVHSKPMRNNQLTSLVVCGALLAATVGWAKDKDDDDELALGEVQPRRLRVHVDPACGATVRTAIRSHPGLLPSPESDAGLLVWCSERPPNGGGATLWLRANDSRSGLRESSHGVIEVRADLESSSWSRRPEYLAFLSEHLDRTAGRPLLERVARSERGPSLARIVPQKPRIARSRPVGEHASSTGLAGLMLLLAALLLLWDAWLVRSSR